MRSVKTAILILLLSFIANGLLLANEFKLKDGSVIKGEVASMSAKGVAFRLESGGFSSTTAWEKFDPETLKEFAKDEKVRRYIEVLIELPSDEREEAAVPEKPKRPPVEIKQHLSPGQPYGHSGVISAMFSGFGLVLTFMLYLGNIYFGYEVSYFKNRPFAVVGGAAALAPVIGPAIFLAFPARKRAERFAVTPEVAEDDVQDVEEAVEVVQPVEVGAAEPEPAKVIPPTQIFRRGEVNINRRFIESKFAGFFRIVPGDAEKDMTLVFKTARGEFTGKRVSRITATELSLVLNHESGTVEELIPLNDIFEIKLRHKDAVD